MVGRGHKPEAHNHFIVAVGSRWGGGAGRPSLQRAARKLQRWEDGGQLSDHEAEEGGTPAVLCRSSCDNAMKFVGFRKSNHT